jgi:multimeric flavodoxin WrbA
MPRLLVVHHTPSPAMDTMLRSVLDGTTADGIDGIDVVTAAALSATVSNVLAADGMILGTPANLGSMSGALKHFFDTIYYPCLVETTGRPYGVYVHGNNDVDGALAAIDKITTGLQWQLAQEPVRVTGEPARADREACWELGAAVAASLMM